MKNCKDLIIGLLHKCELILPDSLYLKWLYRLSIGQRLNLSNPQTFNEKIQWLKLNNKRPEYTRMVDKIEAKNYVANIIGEKYIIPTLAVYDRPENIDFNSLPNQFVLKTTHGGGGQAVVICKDKSTFNIKRAIEVLSVAMDSDISRLYKEYPYKDVPRRIIVEPYMSNDGRELEDYKIHNFNGVPRLILVCRNRFSGVMIDDFYSTQWELMDIHRPGHPTSKSPMTKPDQLDELLELARKLAGEIPFLRTDFYIINGNVFFGELTFYPASGLSKFEPSIWDSILGNWLKLPYE